MRLAASLTRRGMGDGFSKKGPSLRRPQYRSCVAGHSAILRRMQKARSLAPFFACAERTTFVQLKIVFGFAKLKLGISEFLQLAF